MKKRVLIVEDNEKNLILEKDLLETAGFEVLEAMNGEIGIAIARRENPDLVIIDVRLPDIGGIDLAKILKNDEKTSGIPIVFVTASVIGEEVEKMKSIGYSECLVKPINTRTFAKEIARHIR